MLLKDKCFCGWENKEGLKTCPECKKCLAYTEVYSRVTGFYRPVTQWNKGKLSEYNDRKPYNVGPGKFKKREKKE